MFIYLVYDAAGELAEAHLLEPVAEVRAGHFGGTYEGKEICSLPAYSSEDLQRVIDGLDAARAYLAPCDGRDAAQAEMCRAVRIASAILTMFPEESLRAGDEWGLTVEA